MHSYVKVPPVITRREADVPDVRARPRRLRPAIVVCAAALIAAIVSILSVQNQRTPPEPPNIEAFAVRPDGVVVAMTGWDGGLRIVTVGPAKQRRTESLPFQRVCDPMFSPEADRLVFSADDPGFLSGAKHVVEWSLHDRDARVLTTGNVIDMLPVYSPDGKSVVFYRSTPWEFIKINGNGTLFVDDIDRDVARPLSDDVWAWASRPWVNPSDGTVVFNGTKVGGSDSPEPRHFVLPLTEPSDRRRRHVPLPAGAPGAAEFAMSADGRRIVFVGSPKWPTGNDVGVYSVDAPRVHWLGLPTSIQDPAYDPAFSADGRSVLFLRSGDLWRVGLSGRGNATVVIRARDLVGLHGDGVEPPVGSLG
jgi:hypothetical protein